MLLTLSIAALRDILTTAENDDGIDPFDIPALANDELALSGLHVPTWLLKGWNAREIDRFRDRADKAGCPCLVLAEEKRHPMADEDDDTVQAAADRMAKVLNVAHRLGCSSVSMTLSPAFGEEALDFTREHLRDLVKRAERFELNLLLRPSEGVSQNPEGIAALVRDVGGFRIGTCPNFADAAATGDPTAYLKTVAPYASAVIAQTDTFDEEGFHRAYDLAACVDALLAVGYDGSLAIHPTHGDPIEQARRARDAIAELLELEQA